MVLTETTRGSKESFGFGKTNLKGGANWDAKDDEECSALDAIEVCVLDENAKESENSASCGKSSAYRATSKDAEDVAWSSEVKYENLKPENAENKDESGRDGFHGDDPNDNDFSGKDLLGLAWQIARGMVSSQSVTRIFRSQ